MIAILLAFLAASPAHAHPLALGVLVVREGDGTVASSFRFSGTETETSGARLELPAHCRAIGLATERPLEEGGFVREARHACSLDGATIAVRGMEGSGVQIVARVERADGSVREAILDDGSRELAIGRAEALDLAGWVLLGIEHIALGIDHLLFVLALLLLVRERRALVLTITAFTVGHSITLALATLGLVALPSAPVEACIALSILVVALELARDTPTTARAWPIALGFGLLHGLGFAGALAERGLPRSGIATALLGFNVGVEVGQLAFVALVLTSIALARRLGLPSARSPAILALGGTAAYFVIDRCLSLGSMP